METALELSCPVGRMFMAKRLPLCSIFPAHAPLEAGDPTQPHSFQRPGRGEARGKSESLRL